MQHHVEFRMHLIVFTLLFTTFVSTAHRVPNTFVTRIPQIIGNNEPYWTMISYKGFDVITHFEKGNQLGAAWFSHDWDSLSKVGYWVYHYVRFDTAGNILLDLRNFAAQRVYWDRFDIMGDPYHPEPDINYTTDNCGNSWITFSYQDKQEHVGWRIAWMGVDSLSNVTQRSVFEETSRFQDFLVCHSKKYGFHFIGDRSNRAYRNPEATEPMYFDKKYKKPPPAPPMLCIETADGNVLLLSQNLDLAQIHCQRISPKGKLLSVNRLAIDDVTTTIWTHAELPRLREVFYYDNSIWFVTTVHSFEGQKPNRLYLVKFDEDGRAIKPEATKKGKILSIDQKPADAKQFIKVHKGIVYYYAFDTTGNLYYWNSKLGLRARLFAPLYSIHYSHVQDEIVNPTTDDNFFPDSLAYSAKWTPEPQRPKELWETAGKLKHRIKLLIGCDKPERVYKSGELMGIRCGITHVRLGEETYLAKARYSPGKCGWPPEITIYIDSPAEAKKKEGGYLGDDVGSLVRPESDLIEVPPGKIFNPSPDQHYYNKWNGIFKFETPGIYRIWATYTFDSLTSSIKVDHVDTLYSDTLEIVIQEK